MDPRPVLTGRSHTRHLSIETRQHDLLNYDLGEGIPRKPLIFGLLVFGLWNAIMLLVFGLPSRQTFIFYMVPPLTIAWFGAQWSVSNPRRRRFTVWALMIRFMIVGHLPVIGLGARRAARNERTPFLQRRNLPTPGEILMPWTRRPEWERAALGTEQIDQVGRTVKMRPRARLYGNDETAARLQRRAQGRKSR